MYRFAFLASVMANLWRGKGEAARKPEDYLPPAPKRAKRATARDVRSLLEEARALGLMVPEKEG